MTGIPLVNHLADRVVAIEAWKSLGLLNKAVINLLSSLFGPPSHLEHQGGQYGCQTASNKVPIQHFYQHGNDSMEREPNSKVCPDNLSGKHAASSLASTCLPWQRSLSKVAFNVIVLSNSCFIVLMITGLLCGCDDYQSPLGYLWYADTFSQFNARINDWHPPLVRKYPT